MEPNSMETSQRLQRRRGLRELRLSYRDLVLVGYSINVGFLEGRHGMWWWFPYYH
jgi:hypothetical protein